MAAWKDISYKGNNNPALGLLKYRLDSSSNAEHVPAPTGPPGPEGLILPLPFSAGTRQEKEQARPIISKSLPRKRGTLPPCRAQSCWFTVNPSRDSPSSSPSPPDFCPFCYFCPSCPSGRWLRAPWALHPCSRPLQHPWIVSEPCWGGGQWAPATQAVLVSFPHARVQKDTVTHSFSTGSPASSRNTPCFS